MADGLTPQVDQDTISQIKINNTTYDICDAKSRTALGDTTDGLIQQVNDLKNSVAQIDQPTIEIASTVTTYTALLKNIVDSIYTNNNVKNMKIFVMRAHGAAHDNYIIIGQKDGNGVTCLVVDSGHIFIAAKGGSTYHYMQATLTAVS